MPDMAAISIPRTLDSFDEQWSPRLVASVNDQHVKIAKIDGQFIFHAHPDSDELFYVLSGKLVLEIEGENSIEMKEGDVYVVPKGVRHRPVADNAHIMIVERAGTVNTGDEEGSERTRALKDVGEIASRG
jgi:mannose-6-phosphate isomerase-like protein (cupin superfamily)